MPGNAAVPLACGFVELWALPEPKEDNVATRSNLTPLQEAEARRLAAQESKANKVFKVLLVQLVLRVYKEFKVKVDRLDQLALTQL